MTEAEKEMAEIEKEITTIFRFAKEEYNPWGHIDPRRSIKSIIQRFFDEKDRNHAVVTDEKDKQIEQLKQQLAKTAYPSPYENVLDANDSAGEPTIVETGE